VHLVCRALTDLDSTCRPTETITLALGAIVAARKGHPTTDGALDLRRYVETAHLLITLGDDAGPTWIDQALAKLGKKRRVAARVRSFVAAPLVIARSDLLLTGPSMLIRYFAELVGAMPISVRPSLGSPAPSASAPPA